MACGVQHLLSSDMWSAGFVKWHVEYSICCQMACGVQDSVVKWHVECRICQMACGVQDTVVKWPVECRICCQMACGVQDSVVKWHVECRILLSKSLVNSGLCCQTAS